MLSDASDSAKVYQTCVAGNAPLADKINHIISAAAVISALISYLYLKHCNADEMKRLRNSGQVGLFNQGYQRVVHFEGCR